MNPQPGYPSMNPQHGHTSMNPHHDSTNAGFEFHSVGGNINNIGTNINFDPYGTAHRTPDTLINNNTSNNLSPPYYNNSTCNRILGTDNSFPSNHPNGTNQNSGFDSHAAPNACGIGSDMRYGLNQSQPNLQQQNTHQLVPLTTPSTQWTGLPFGNGIGTIHNTNTNYLQPNNINVIPLPPILSTLHAPHKNSSAPHPSSQPAPKKPAPHKKKPRKKTNRSFLETDTPSGEPPNIANPGRHANTSGNGPSHAHNNPSRPTHGTNDPNGASNAADDPPPSTRETINQFMANAGPGQAAIEAAQRVKNQDTSSWTLDQLRARANSQSKKKMTHEDEAFFFKFYDTQQRALANAAYERRVSVGMVENLLGRKQVQRSTSSWNNFTAQNGALFKGKGRGVQNSGAMLQLKVMWDAMSPDKQLSYKKTNLPAVEEEEGKTEGNLVDEPAHLVALRAHSTSLRIAESCVNKWMEDWQKKLAKATPGAADFIAQIYAADGLKNYQSRLQSYINGARLNGVSAAISKKSKKKASSCVNEARERLAELVSNDTGGRKTTWTWQGCDKALGKLGFKVVFYPGATSQPAWIKSLSNRLTGSQATLIVDNINAGFLRVIKDKEALLSQSCSLAGTSTTGELRLNDNNETAAPAPGPSTTPSTTLLATTKRKQAQPCTKKKVPPKRKHCCSRRSPTSSEPDLAQGSTDKSKGDIEITPPPKKRCRLVIPRSQSGEENDEDPHEMTQQQGVPLFTGASDSGENQDNQAENTDEQGTMRITGSM
ncbi:hypothetical protein PCASD_14371 [Puccinia coronata f. sp. avenae]|uniref:Uncharacterized protein n=1 Tax=Puccinia coronata f. sp. avenae TaxID=200324 RepID=A0A2N5SMK0_9BASI|nr:hypothetical protein PCASD_14371 [Puccinia coronata f. sp. avenae]